MSAATHIAPGVALVNTVDPTTRKKFLRSYPEVVKYLLKKFASDQAIAKMDPTILHYTQVAKMTLIRYTDDLYSMSCKMTDVYDE